MLDPVTPAAVVPSGRRERKKIETRRALRQAALRLFAERGYDETTVEDITEAADVAVRTFFRYFRSKHDVLVGEIAELSVRLRHRLDARPPDELPMVAVRTAVCGLVSGMVAAREFDRESLLLQARLIEEEPELYTANVEVHQCFDQVIANFVAGRTGGHPSRDLLPRLIGSLTATAMQTALSVWYHRDGEGSLSGLLAESFDLLAAGLVPPGRTGVPEVPEVPGMTAPAVTPAVTPAGARPARSARSADPAPAGGTG